jgi:hypothetical protein
MRAEQATDRVGQGIAQALRKAWPANAGEAIASIYPPDAAGDEGLDDLIDRLRSIPHPQQTPPGGPGGGSA